MGNLLSIKKLTDKKAQALILGLIVVAVLMILSGAFLSKALNENRLIQRERLETEMFYLAEGAIEDTISQFKSAIANFQIDASTNRFPVTGNITTTFSKSDSLPAGATAFSVITEAEASERIVTDPDGTQVRVKNYQVTTNVQYPSDANFNLTLNQIITRRLIFTFQHAVFYEDDLELFPGPNMTFSGRIHSNHDIYLGCNNTLTIDSGYLRSSGKIFNRRKDNGAVPGGTVDIKEAGSVPAVFFAMAGLDSDSPTWTAESQTRWNGTVQSGVHGVTKLTAPAVGSIQAGGYYDNNADIKIVNGTITKSGVGLVEGTDIPPGTISTTTTFYNNREGKWVKMTEIDLAKLGGGNYGGVTYSNQLSGSNGLIYATRNDAGSNQPGIRLINGSEIKRADGLTVVSDDPLYIQGDYNTSTNNITKKPTAIICDALNILSNNWDDSNSSSSLSNRIATATNVNTAFIAGIDTTTSGNYNGGLENYPRLHETWSGKELRIRGSFVALWNSEIATGAWHYGAPQYKAPIRNWDYDTDFQSGTMPPFTPWAVEVIKGAWWKG